MQIKAILVVVVLVVLLSACGATEPVVEYVPEVPDIEADSRTIQDFIDAFVEEFNDDIHDIRPFDSGIIHDALVDSFMGCRVIIIANPNALSGWIVIYEFETFVTAEFAALVNTEISGDPETRTRAVTNGRFTAVTQTGELLNFFESI